MPQAPNHLDRGRLGKFACVTVLIADSRAWTEQKVALTAPVARMGTLQLLGCSSKKLLPVMQPCEPKTIQ
jgi:hypothetical protein